MNLSASDRVLEIGPGKGALTSLLLDELQTLAAVEIDTVLAEELKRKFGKKLKLYHDDVLHLDLGSMAGAMGGNIRIVGNIPYNITSAIIFWIIDASSFVSDCTLMMQREVAQRLVAKPRTKDYGILSVMAQYYSTPSLLFTVSPACFFPEPEVTSAVVALNFEKPNEKRAADDVLFRSVVRATFGKRRKTLRNGLRGMNIPAAVLSRLSANLDRRPEELSVAEFTTLADELADLEITAPPLK